MVAAVEDQARGAAAGVTDWLIKPFTELAPRGDFFGAERSEWDPETLEEGRYDAAKTMRMFEETNARYGAS
jgi:hypothetical protein